MLALFRQTRQNVAASGTANEEKNVALTCTVGRTVQFYYCLKSKTYQIK